MNDENDAMTPEEAERVQADPALARSPLGRAARAVLKLAAQLGALRETSLGRTTPPSAAAVEAVRKDGGSWLVVAPPTLRSVPTELVSDPLTLPHSLVTLYVPLCGLWRPRTWPGGPPGESRLGGAWEWSFEPPSQGQMLAHALVSECRYGCGGLWVVEVGAKGFFERVEVRHRDGALTAYRAGRSEGETVNKMLDHHRFDGRWMRWFGGPAPWQVPEDQFAEAKAWAASGDGG